MMLRNDYSWRPFSGDPLHHGEVARLIGKWGVQIAMETGTNHGHTTLALSFLCREVVTAENNPDCASEARKLFSSAQRDNICLVQKSSPEAIRESWAKLNGQRVIYYLDAHWGAYWPLLDELRAIALIEGPRPLIVIHDFQVPGHPDLGYDVYQGTKLDLDYVSQGLVKIYRDRYSLHFNTLVFGARRGVLYVEPEE